MDTDKPDTEDLITAATIALSTINAVYDWLGMVDDAGGLTSISGVAKANAMHASLKKNRPRVDKLVTEPLVAAIRAARDAN